MSEQQKIVLADELEKKVAYGIRKLGYIVIDKWAISFESKTCNDCPAYKWVVHRTGQHPCRLFVQINERQSEDSVWYGTPARECLRPLSVGASYITQVSQKFF